jgi:hypothetical protein
VIAHAIIADRNGDKNLSPCEDQATLSSSWLIARVISGEHHGDRRQGHGRSLPIALMYAPIAHAICGRRRGDRR